MTAALRAVIERLEAGEIGKSMDGCIGRVCGVAPKSKNIRSRTHSIGGEWKLLRVEEVFPLYTTSLDAALTLVPEGYDWMIHRTNDGLTISACVGDTTHHFADTPPLAVCIASLRARLA